MPFIISTNLSKFSIIYLRNIKIDFDSRKKNSNNLCLCFNRTPLSICACLKSQLKLLSKCAQPNKWNSMAFVRLKVSNVLFDLFSINFSKII